MPMLRNVAANSAGIRRAGAASLDLAYVASGRLDGYWEFNLKPWDIAAGIVMVQEAGGIVRPLEGSTDVLADGHILATHLKLGDEVTMDWQSDVKGKRVVYRVDVCDSLIIKQKNRKKQTQITK